MTHIHYWDRHHKDGQRGLLDEDRVDTDTTPLSPSVPTFSGEGKSACYLGVDPGASGGIAALTPIKGGDVIVEICPMPVGEEKILDLIQSFTWKEAREGNGPPVCCAVIEAVTGYIAGDDTQGATGGGRANGQRMFTFGQNYGSLRMALTANSIPYVAIAAKTWQKGLHISPRRRDESKSDWKGRLRDLAQSLYPDVKVTLKVSDAVLLAEYSRRFWSGTLATERKKKP